MGKAKIDALLIVKQEDIFYLTGFNGEDAALVVGPRSAHLITDSRFDEQANRECPWLGRTLRKGAMSAAIAGRVRRARVARLGVDEASMTVGQFDALGKKLGRRSLKRVGALVGKLRLLKDKVEIEAILEAIDVAQQAFAATRKTIRAGQTERQVAARLEYELQRRGATGSSFPPIVAVGANAALPHAQPGGTAVSGSKLILFDWGATCHCYMSDLTRVLVPRRIAPRIRRMYEICLEAQSRAIEAIRPGAKMASMDRVARRHIKEAGFGEYFGHGLGHGIGLEIHEGPTLSPRAKECLEPGMVVTVEPGIYVPGVGGVRIEDDVLVTGQGCRVLSWLSKDLDDVTLSI